MKLGSAALRLAWILAVGVGLTLLLAVDADRFPAGAPGSPLVEALDTVPGEGVMTVYLTPDGSSPGSRRPP